MSARDRQLDLLATLSAFEGTDVEFKRGKGGVPASPPDLPASPPNLAASPPDLPTSPPDLAVIPPDLPVSTPDLAVHAKVDTGGHPEAAERLQAIARGIRESLELLFPKVPSHREQAYRTTAKGSAEAST